VQDLLAGQIAAGVIVVSNVLPHISRAREWDEMEPHAVPSHPIPL
jgi:hypothetical protein